MSKTAQAEEPKPCPNCGRCPTCGHAPVVVKPVYPVPYYPWVQPHQPYVQPYTITYDTNTANGGSGSIVTFPSATYTVKS